MPEIGIYACVSTTDQDPQRQLNELREFAEDTYESPAIHTQIDIIRGTETDRGEEYQRLCSDIQDGTLDVIVVHELSRLSRLGAGEIHEFLEFCLSHKAVQDLEAGLEISLDDDLVDRAVSQLIAGMMVILAAYSTNRSSAGFDQVLTLRKRPADGLDGRQPDST